MKRVLFLLFSLCCAFVASAEKFVIYDDSGVPQAKMTVEPGDTYKLQEGMVAILQGAIEGAYEGLVVKDGWTGKVISDDEAVGVLPIETSFELNKADNGEDGIYTAWTLDGRYINPQRIKSGEMDGYYVEFKGFGNGKKIKVLLLKR